MIKNIIFDIGKVLVSYEPDAYMESLGISADKQAKINKAMFQNKLWDISDQGIYSKEELLKMTLYFVAIASWRIIDTDIKCYIVVS